MKLRLLAFEVALADIEQELVSVMLGLEVVGVPPFNWANLLGDSAFSMWESFIATDRSTSRPVAR